MNNLKTEIESIVRKYKKSKLKEWEVLRKNKENDSGRVLVLTDIIRDLETALGYSVSVDNVCTKGSSVEERLNAIERENYVKL